MRFRCLADEKDGLKCKIILFAHNQRIAANRKRKTRSIRSLSTLPKFTSRFQEEQSYLADDTVIGKELLNIELATRKSRSTSIENQDPSGHGFKENEKIKKLQTSPLPVFGGKTNDVADFKETDGVKEIQTTQSPLPGIENDNQTGLGIHIPDEILKIPTTTTPLETEVSVSDAVQLLANKYCRYRDPGLYMIPLICDVFISCSTGGQAKPLVCPERTSFNPRINVCDHASYYECHKGDDNNGKCDQSIVFEFF